MSITTREMKQEDLHKCVWIEKSATPSTSYINDVWEMFAASEGDLTGAFLDGKLGGFGKLTRLYGNYGWLEALRVHESMQNKGLGKAIYERYKEQIQTLELTSVGMYTGLHNIASKSLAEKYNLALDGRYSEFICPVAPTAQEHTFSLVPEEEAEALLSPFYGKMGKHIVINRTFYPVAAGLATEFAKQKWVYKDSKGNILLAGHRFQPEKALHLAFTHGDFDAIVAFAHQLAAKQKSQTLSAIRAFDDDAIASVFTKQHFSKSAGDFITLWS